MAEMNNMNQNIENRVQTEGQEPVQAQHASDKGEKKDFLTIKERDLFRFIANSLELIDKRTVMHSIRTAYIYAKMIESTKQYTKQEIAQYAVIGFLHDLGELKLLNDTRRSLESKNNSLTHSIYSYLYIKNFSPLGEKGNVVLYHHVPMEQINEEQIQDPLEAVLLGFSVQLERLLGKYESADVVKEFFVKYAKKEKYSKIVLQGLAVAMNAVRQYNIVTHLYDGDYEEELFDWFDKLQLTEEEKRKYLELVMYAFDFQTDQAFLDTLRTISISEQIGQVMLVSELERNILSYGTLLYDIGKFAVPVDILRKPDKLTEFEMDIVRSHVSYTEYMLKDFFDERIVNVAARHHEKLDGSGYPRGVVAKDLTLPERILAVADIVSALSTDKPYRKALKKIQILDILNADVENNKLCPHVVNAMEKKYDIIMAGANTKVQKASKAFVIETAIQFNQIYAQMTRVEQK